MSTYKTVAVAGATGNLGPTLVQELVAAGFRVTVLSRSRTAPRLPSSVRIIEVDYDSQSSLVTALDGQDAVVSNLPNHGAQKPLIDAAIAAGVKRILPSEFGCNIAGSKDTAELPIFKTGKTVIQGYLHERADQISYTFVSTGLFLDWGLQVKFLMNFQGPALLHNGGEEKHSMTTLSDIGKAVAGILKHPQETKNRAVYVQSAALSQLDLLALAKKARPDFDVETKVVDLAQSEKEAYALLERGEDVGAVAETFIYIGALGDAKKYGNNWSSKNDNALLGIQEMSEEELEGMVARYI